MLREARPSGAPGPPRLARVPLTVRGRFSQCQVRERARCGGGVCSPLPLSLSVTAACESGDSEHLTLETKGLPSSPCLAAMCYL